LDAADEACMNSSIRIRVPSKARIRTLATAAPLQIRALRFGKPGLPGADGTAAVIAHEAAVDPHPQYASAASLAAEAGARAAADQALATSIAGKADAVHGHAIADVSGLQSALAGKLDTSARGAANGVAGLDAGGKVPPGQLPAIAPESTDAVPEGTANLYHTANRVNALIGAAVGSVVQGFSQNLAALAGQASEAFGRGLLNLASAAALRTAIALPTTTVAGRLARYTDAAGALGETPGMVYDATNQRLGLGVTTPEYMLHTNFENPSWQGFGHVVIKRLAFASDASLPHLGQTVGTALIARHGTQEVGYFGCGNDSVLRIGAWVGQWIGLQFTTQGVIMSRMVVDQAGFTFQPSICTDATGVNECGFYSPGGLGSNTLGFITQRTERARFDAVGNFGLGATNPVCRLDVAGGPIRKRTSYTVATLPAASLGDGMETYVTDSNATLAAGHGNVVAGGGSNYVPVYSRGGQWLIG
jgi:hypothetical protein